MCVTIYFLHPPPPPGADIRSVCTEAGMFAIRARRKVRSLDSHMFYGAVNNMIISFQCNGQFIHMTTA